VGPHSNALGGEKEQKCSFFVRRQLRKFENATLVARRGEHFRIFPMICLVAHILPKRRLSTQEFTRFLSMVSSQRRATRSDVSFQTK